jgi:hypothetical protein
MTFEVGSSPDWALARTLEQSETKFASSKIAVRFSNWNTG